MRIKHLYNKLQGSSLFRDSFWALLGNILGKGLALIAGIVVARFLGSEEYGEYGMIRNNLTMIAIFSSLGLGYTATKFIAECKGNAAKAYVIHKIVMRITWTTSGIIMVLVAVLSKQLAAWLDAPHLESLLFFASVAVVLNAVNTTQIGELSGFKAYKEITFNNTWAGVVTFVTSVILTYFYSIDGAVIALVISFATNCWLNKRSIKKYLSQQGAIEYGGNYRKILSFTFPVALQESTYSITHWLSTILLIKLAGYGELGLYSAATQWMAVMLFVPGALRNVALSHLSEHNDDMVTNKRILKRMVQINLITTLFPFMAIALLSGWICSWYGDSYYGLQSVLNVCMFTTVVNSLTNVFTQNMIAMNKNWYLFVTRTVRDLFILATATFLIQTCERGALMYATASLIFQFAYLLLLAFKQYALYKSTL